MRSHYLIFFLFIFMYSTPLAVEIFLFPLRGADVVIDDVGAHCIAQHAGLFQCQCSLRQRSGDFAGLACLVGVTLEFLFQLQFFFNACDSGRNLGGDCEVRVQVTATDTAFDAYVTRAVADDTVSRGAVIE